MPVTDHFERVSLRNIWVERHARQRREIDSTQLRSSIAQRGVLNPVLVTAETGPSGQHWKLIAGERRFDACQFLELPDIPIRKMEDLSPLELVIIELEENIKRQDLTWQEIVATIETIHKAYGDLTPGWTMTQTADAMGYSLPTISLYLRVAAELNNEKIRTSGTVREAFNHLARKDQRAGAEALQDLIESTRPAEGGKTTSAPLILRSEDLSMTDVEYAILSEPPPPPPIPIPIINQSFLDWAPSYEGPKFNLLHCDFPYGIGVFSGPQGREGGNLAANQGIAGYADKREDFFTLLEGFCENLFKFCSFSAHVMFWYSEENGDEMRRIFKLKAPDIHFIKHPLIWFKSDNSGIASDVRRRPRHTYETCLFGTVGERHIVQVKADCYPAPTDKTLHASAKSEPMLRHFMSMLVDESTALLDPTCGSGSALRAAESLGASRVFGIESDPGHFKAATWAMNSFRGLRQLAKAAEGTAK